MATLQRFPAATPAETINDVLVHDGALVLEDVLTATEVDRVLAETMPYIEATAPGRDDFTGRRTTRTGALVARSPACRDLVMHERVLAAANRFLEPYCHRIQLHLAQVIRLMPGQPAQAIHRDRWAWGKFLKDLEPQFNTIWALSDFTEENGATVVAPGSVPWPNDRLPTEAELTRATMRRGSVLLYSGSVYHGGGANGSDGDRIGLNITYTLGWLRQEENQYLACPPDIAKDLPEPLQELLGYTVGSYALGYYTPPLGPGEGPEVVGPEYALGRRSEGMGSEELFDSVTRS